MTKLLLMVLFAGIALGDPIPVSMSGEFGLDNFMDGNVQFGISGSNDSGSVDFGGDLPLGLVPPDQGFSAYSLHNTTLQIYPATVDGIESPFWIFSLESSGQGFLEILDSSGNVIIGQDFVLVAPIQYSYYFESGPRFLPDGGLNDEWEVQGRFSTPVGDEQSAVPESGSAILAGAGLLWMLTIQQTKLRGVAALRRVGFRT